MSSESLMLVVAISSCVNRIREVSVTTSLEAMNGTAVVLDRTLRPNKPRSAAGHNKARSAAA